MPLKKNEKPTKFCFSLIMTYSILHDHSILFIFLVLQIFLLFIVTYDLSEASGDTYS